MKKDAIIFALIVLVVILSLGDEGAPQALIEADPAQASDCSAPKLPQSLLPRDHWEGSQVKRSKDGGTV